jgi:hypothetical protein
MAEALQHGQAALIARISATCATNNEPVPDAARSGRANAIVSQPRWYKISVRSWEHLDPEIDRITAIQELRDVWANGNGLAELPNGDIVVSFRTISTIIIIERKTGAIIWKLGAPPLCGQHAPTPLANGNLLIFDNGPHRLDHPIPFSRVIEVEPATKRIVWEYREKRESDFFSPRISNAQRLPNGNTLICEGDFGRLFEVTVSGDIVWEYVNPYFGGPPMAQNNRIFRAYRYSADEIARARAAGSALSVSD